MTTLDKDKAARNKAFGQRLKACRQACKLTQEQLAEHVSRSIETISKIERGLIYPSVDMLVLVCEKLNVSMDELVGIQGASNPELSKRQVQLLAEAMTLIKGLDEATLAVAVSQLEALKTLP